MCDIAVVGGRGVGERAQALQQRGWHITAQNEIYFVAKHALQLAATMHGTVCTN